MNHTLDSSRPGGIEEGQGVPDGIGMRKAFVVEANPVRVVQNGNPTQRFDELLWLVKIEGNGAQTFAKRVFPLQRVRQGDQAFAFGKQAFGNVLSGVAKCPGDCMEVRWFGFRFTP